MRPPRPSTSALERGGLFEEVTVAVTGTAIEAPAINMPHAVTVVSRDTLEQQGSTQLVDLFRNLSVSHGVVGERNSWYNSNQPATSRRTSRGEIPPWVNVEQAYDGFTHDPKGRRLKMSLTYRFGGRSGWLGTRSKAVGARGSSYAGSVVQFRQPPRSQGRGRVVPHASRGHSLEVRCGVDEAFVVLPIQRPE
ncbi:MAG: hypothetical protein J4F37_02220, partial [Acidobacteria bacterium]|nr:hypothetical protein [Acidobacteriota bacterium]